MPPRVIQFYAKHVYGVRKLYPANADASKLAEVAGTATLLQRHIDLARDLGFAVEEVAMLADGGSVRVALLSPRVAVGAEPNRTFERVTARKLGAEPMSRADEAAEAGRRG